MTGISHDDPLHGWGQDDFTRYLEKCRHNQLATFANMRSEVIDLTAIDKMFVTLLKDAVYPDPVVPMDFLRRAHSAFLTAGGAIMAGQIYEAQSLLRVCLEQGGYAHFIGKNVGRGNRWRARHNGSAEKKKVRKEFTNGNISRQMKAKAPKLEAAYSEFYDRLIDNGAHPNERGMSLSSSIEKTDDGGENWMTIYLHGVGLPMQAGFRTAAQVGLLVLLIAQDIYPDRMQAPGIQDLLNDMKWVFRVLMAEKFLPYGIITFLIIISAQCAFFNSNCDEVAK